MMKDFGKTGLAVSSIVYGSSYLGNLYTNLPQEQKVDLVRKWKEATEGTLVIDSAGKYGAGLALENIGYCLKELGVKPEEVLISNKLGWYRVPLTTEEPTFEPGAWVDLEYDAEQRISYQGILDCYEQGCELLGEYKPELVSVHDPDEYIFAATDEADRAKRLVDVKEAYRALFELKEQGKVKAVGIGSKDWEVIRDLYETVKFDWVMFANKFTVYHHPKPIVAFLDKLLADGVGIVNSAVFNAGFLVGGQYFDYRILDENNPEDKPMFEWRERFMKVCEEQGVAPGVACIQFSLSHPAIASIALNTSKPEKVKRNIETVETVLPKSFWDAMKAEGLVDADYVHV